MTRAEIASLEAYPLRFDLPDDLLRRMLHSGERKYFQEGYERAEKDLALTAEDIRHIIKIHYDIVFHETSEIKCGDVADEVLKRFNEQRKK